MATATNSNSSATSVEKAVAAKQRYLASRGPGYFHGQRILKQTITLATADLDAADSTDILVFPQHCYLTGLLIKVTELDTGVDAITFDVKVDTDVLINESTVGQAGGNDELDANLDPAILDVSGSTLKFVVSTGPGTANAAGGTLTVYAFVNLDGVIDSW